MKISKKFLSMILALVMVLGLLPTIAFATDAEEDVVYLSISLAISQRASRVDWVYHALTGECSLIYPYLRINRLHFLFCGKTTKR